MKLPFTCFLLIAVLGASSHSTEARILDVPHFINNKIDKMSNIMSNTANTVGRKVAHTGHLIIDKTDKTRQFIVPDFVEKKINNIYKPSSSKSVRTAFNPYASKQSIKPRPKTNFSVPALTDDATLIKQAVAKAHKDTGLPINLINSLIKKESSFNPRAISHSGARGLTQLMPSTAKGECGLEKHELFDINKNIQCGIGYLSKQVDYFGRYDLALAAYNAGPGAVRRAMQKTNSKSISRVTSVLKSETAPYVTTIMHYMSQYKG